MRQTRLAAVKKRHVVVEPDPPHGLGPIGAEEVEPASAVLPADDLLHDAVGRVPVLIDISPDLIPAVPAPVGNDRHSHPLAGSHVERPDELAVIDGIVVGDPDAVAADISA